VSSRLAIQAYFTSALSVVIIYMRFIFFVTAYITTSLYNVAWVEDKLSLTLAPEPGVWIRDSVM
jgi:hypothetical protein